MTDPCKDCKHCPENWRDASQLPLCSHPNAHRSEIDGRIIWAMYAVYDGHCGRSYSAFEPRQEIELTKQPVERDRS